MVVNLRARSSPRSRAAAAPQTCPARRCPGSGGARCGRRRCCLRPAPPDRPPARPRRCPPRGGAAERVISPPSVARQLRCAPSPPRHATPLSPVSPRFGVVHQQLAARNGGLPIAAVWRTSERSGGPNGHLAVSGGDRRRDCREAEGPGGAPPASLAHFMSVERCQVDDFESRESPPRRTTLAVGTAWRPTRGMRTRQRDEGMNPTRRVDHRHGDHGGRCARRRDVRARERYAPAHR